MGRANQIKSTQPKRSRKFEPKKILLQIRVGHFNAVNLEKLKKLITKWKQFVAEKSICAADELCI